MDVPFLTSKMMVELELPHGFAHAPMNYSYAHGDKEKVDFNRDQLRKALGLRHMTIPNEVHSGDAAVVDTYSDGVLFELRVDAVVTKLRGQGVAILTADCGPVLMADKEAGVVGAAHAGWKGALAGVLEDTILKMESLGAKRENIVAVLGPTIAMPSFELGPDTESLFIEHDERSSKFFFVSETYPGKKQFDLPAYNIWRLAEAGIKKVENLALDTYTDPDRFFSYRYWKKHEGSPKGTMLAVIGMH